MAQKAKTKRRTPAAKKKATKVKKAKKTKKSKKTAKLSLARRNYEYDHQYGLRLRGK